mgnify:CR=1 FL=1
MRETGKNYCEGDRNNNEENRNIRDDKYKQKNELNVVTAKYKEEEMLKVLRESR